MYRDQFPIFQTHPDLVYLDSAATSLKPQVVIDTLSNYYSQYSANIHRGLYLLAEQSTTAYEHARHQVATFLNANSDSQVVWTKSTTESLNLLAFSLSKVINKSSEIILTQIEHHANLLPWQRLAKEKKAKLKFISIDKQTFHLDFSSLSNLINQNTKIVALPHVSNVTGEIIDIRSVSKQIKSINPKVCIIVDGAQAVSHLSIDVQELGCDFYAFSGHKLFGPTGIGVLWGKQSLLNSIPPFLLGGDMVSVVDFSSAQFLPTPQRFEAGTPPIAEAIGLGAACEYISALDQKKVSSHMHELTNYALDKLSTIPGLQIIGPQTNRIGLISFTIPNIHPHDIAQYLGDHNICIRAGHHCAMPLHTLLSLPATARISLQFYSTKADIDKTVSTLKQLVKLFNK